MKILFCILALAAVAAGCNLSEKTETEINPRPSLTVGFNYHNKNGVNTLVEVGRLHLFVFDSKNKLFKTAEADTGQFYGGRGIELLSGVPEDAYTLVALANVEQAVLPPMVAGESSLTDLRITLAPL